MSGYTGLTVSPFFTEGAPVGEDDIEMNTYGFDATGNISTVPDTRYVELLFVTPPDVRFFQVL
jgi:hypothetical protein